MVTPAALLSKFGIAPDVDSLPYSRYQDSWRGALVGSIGDYDVLVRRNTYDPEDPPTSKAEATYLMYSHYGALIVVTDFDGELYCTQYVDSIPNKKNVLTQWADLIKPYVTSEVIDAIFKPLRTPYQESESIILEDE